LFAKGKKAGLLLIMKSTLLFFILLLALYLSSFGQNFINSHYQILKLSESLSHYKSILSSLQLTPFSKETDLKLGDIGSDVKKLKHHLIIHKAYLSPEDSTKDEFDIKVESAVKNFQLNHGLTPDGIFKGKTVQAMNTPILKIIKQIEANLERWQKFPTLSQPYLLVNIPEFTLRVINHDSIDLEMKIIVGKTKHKTAQLQSEITNIIINPYWNVPPSIANNELLPLIKKNNRYLAQHHMKIIVKTREGGIVDEKYLRSNEINSENLVYSIQQEPGEWNALGRIKFNFYNPYNIYLHDTPEKNLFERKVRAFSHGCVRVEKPIALASYMIKKDYEEILVIIDSGKYQTISLHMPVPIIITYFNTWIDMKGNLNLRDDIYHLNSK
jgi:murein L,D-transpeptidase YcbB/YkuD